MDHPAEPGPGPNVPARTPPVARTFTPGRGRARAPCSPGARCHRGDARGTGRGRPHRRARSARLHGDRADRPRRRDRARRGARRRGPADRLDRRAGGRELPGRERDGPDRCSGTPSGRSRRGGSSRRRGGGCGRRARTGTASTRHRGTGAAPTRSSGCGLRAGGRRRAGSGPPRWAAPRSVRTGRARRAAFFVGVSCAQPGVHVLLHLDGHRPGGGDRPRPRPHRADRRRPPRAARRGGHRARCEVLADVQVAASWRDAAADDLEAASGHRRRAASTRMTRRIDPEPLATCWRANLDHPRWDDVAERCLSCTNCTLVCPTCFCTAVEDVTTLDGDRAERVAAMGLVLHARPLRSCTGREACAATPAPATDNGSPTSCRRGGTSSASRVVSGAGAASPGARPGSISPRRSRPCPERSRTDEDRRPSATCWRQQPVLSDLEPADIDLLAGCARNEVVAAGDLARSRRRAGRPLLRRAGRAGRARVAGTDRPARHRDARPRATWSAGRGSSRPTGGPTTWRRSSRRGWSRIEARCLRAKCEHDPAFGYRLMQRFAQVVAERLYAARAAAARPLRSARCPLRPTTRRAVRRHAGPMVPVAIPDRGARRRDRATRSRSTSSRSTSRSPEPEPGQFTMLYAFGVGEVAISVSGCPATRATPPHDPGGRARRPGRCAACHRGRWSVSGGPSARAGRGRRRRATTC